MARKQRVEYPGVIYHVINRCDHREPIIPLPFRSLRTSAFSASASGFVVLLLDSVIQFSAPPEKTHQNVLNPWKFVASHGWRSASGLWFPVSRRKQSVTHSRSPLYPNTGGLHLVTKSGATPDLTGAPPAPPVAPPEVADK
jgi:hypothetical protein